MHDRHTNRQRYFREQAQTTQKYVIPYLQQVTPVTGESRILEVGCGEGGNLMPFVEMGCEVIGVDINQGKIDKGNAIIKERAPEANASLRHDNIYDLNETEIGTFDVIFLRDVIEHLPDQDRFFKHVQQFMKPTGVIFFGFPPWRMPFGGHQQICEGKILSKLPFFHLLPTPLYAMVLRAFGESDRVVNSLLEIKETGISIHRFNQLVRRNGFRFARQTYYFINPNYEIKFGLTPRVQTPLIAGIPHLRDFFITCYYSVIRR
ncbi:bifunctional 2-polyprenyl-6-hydroxyphenol methylase/3-demethylubiquinol 3-O-methyltransferase UbiG [Lewinella sp. W8]|uniref:class I SAM-dependent methyltransferase n=1 Tax=Lewinella sp. W8 TaxID=2528208 RepID=UPI001068ABD8|nr:class I SAM-dependent methyltransferase [Lewinella sp. W8]MTB51313.1 methyltransferase domain-containing protein [Lewinella sp. W8]